MAVLDIESTGTDPLNDRIIEISILKIGTDGNQDIRTRRFKPEIPISESAIAVHGITDKELQHEPAFKSVAQALMNYIFGCDIAYFGGNKFDVKILYYELYRAGIEWQYQACRLIDVGNIYKIKEERSLTAAVKYYLGRENVGAHGAEADTKATFEVLISQLQKYEDLPDTVEELSLFSNFGKPVLDLSGKFSYNDSNDIILNFGPKFGEKALDNIDFVEWMLYRANFPPDTRVICTNLIAEYYEQK